MPELLIPDDTLGFIKALASDSRLAILLLFVDGQARTVNEIKDAVGLGQSTTSEHLALMKKSGILVSEKQGKEVYYQPNGAVILQHLDRVSQLLRSCCP